MTYRRCRVAIEAGGFDGVAELDGDTIVSCSPILHAALVRHAQSHDRAGLRAIVRRFGWSATVEEIRGQ